MVEKVTVTVVGGGGGDRSARGGRGGYLEVASRMLFLSSISSFSIYIFWNIFTIVYIKVLTPLLNFSS